MRVGLTGWIGCVGCGGIGRAWLVGRFGCNGLWGVDGVERSALTVVSVDGALVESVLDGGAIQNRVRARNNPGSAGALAKNDW
jgi:hypothetical protein